MSELSGQVDPVAADVSTEMGASSVAAQTLLNREGTPEEVASLIG